MANPTQDYSDKTNQLSPLTKGTKLGDLVANHIANLDPKVGDSSSGSFDVQTADDPPQTVTTNIPESKDRTNMVKQWEHIGNKLFEFLKAMDLGTEGDFTLAINGGASLKFDKTPAKITLSVGGVTLTMDGTSGVVIQNGASKIEVSAASVKVTAPLINLN